MKYGFEIGDLVCISGELAYAALGFELLKIMEENPKSKEIMDKIKSIDSTLIDLAILKALNPEAKYEEGHILRDYNTSNNRITATDITDGLASELYEILSSDKKYFQSDKIDNDSNSDNTYEKGIRIYEDKLPVEDEFKEIANILGLNYLDLFLHVGEDFELLFTINKELKDKLSSDMNYYVIGEITEGNTVEIVLSNGSIEKISSRGYEHLK
jgi:thiamine-monophosphate kinase